MKGVRRRSVTAPFANVAESTDSGLDWRHAPWGEVQGGWWNMSESTPIAADKRLLADEVFRSMARDIVDGRLAPGEQLRDADLALRLHVSRMPVREALQRLERIGLVEMRPSRFTRVTIVTPETIEHARLCAGAQAGIVARAAVPQLTPAERLRALQLLAALDEVLDDPRAASKARRALYSYLSDRARNPLHHRLMQDMEYALERNLSLLPVPADRIADMRAVDRRLAEAIERGDGDAAERLVREQHGV